ncbi:hypothetical protein TNCV_2182071 [Trichonephila clavipes]|uniref:Uncharacterized protein n=1 Tax=Trichonephila clavipes TaxID=2585209 RepID=A0A8X6VV21_TRICX|nr:hypothetical protein TNCV_2182071 [Trichonephila clavipes]
MGPPIRKREGEKWTVPDVLIGWKNRRKENEKTRRKELEKTRAGRFRKRRGESRSFFCSVMLTSNPIRE